MNGAIGVVTFAGARRGELVVRYDQGEVAYTPEFYVMKHFAHFIAPGAARLGLQGPWTGDAVAFENPDGTRVVVIGNPFAEERGLTFVCENMRTAVTLAGCSFNTLVFEKSK